MPTNKSKTIGMRVNVVSLANLVRYYKEKNIPIVSQGAILRRAIEDLNYALIKTDPEKRWFYEGEELEARQYLTSIGLIDHIGFNPDIIGHLRDKAEEEKMRSALATPSALLDALKEDPDLQR